VQNRDESVASASANVKAIINLIYALLALAIFIALLGIASTLVPTAGQEPMHQGPKAVTSAVGQLDVSASVHDRTIS
jgi:hypothetical protein